MSVQWHNLLKLVSDMVKASAVRSYKAMDGLFWNQFHLQRESRDAKRG
jgi:hypothetical protein